jgi:hypothetical protein
MCFMATNDRAGTFWRWFTEQEESILEAVRSSDHDWLRIEMTTRVLGLLPKDHTGLRINWEIGPGEEKEWRFCLSPLVKTNLKTTKHVISAAPELPRWEFFPAKPPKAPRSNDYWLVEPDGSEHLFATAGWEYVLSEYDSGLFSIELVGQIPRDADEHIRKKAAHLIVEGILGEAFFLEHTVDVELRETNEVSPSLPKSKLPDLKRHLAQLLSRIDDR